MPLDWKSAGLCLLAAFPPRAAVCSHFFLLPLESSYRWKIYYPEALLSLAAPSSSIVKDCSGNYFGYRSVTKFWDQVFKRSWTCHWISLLSWSIPAISKHRQLLLSFVLSRFWFFCFFTQNVSWNCWKSCLWQRGRCYLRNWFAGGRGAESLARCVVSQILP